MLVIGLVEELVIVLHLRISDDTIDASSVHFDGTVHDLHASFTRACGQGSSTLIKHGHAGKISLHINLFVLSGTF